MRQAIIEALQAHAKGHIEKHKANVEVLLEKTAGIAEHPDTCLLYTSPSPRDLAQSRMPSSA